MQNVGAYFSSGGEAEEEMMGQRSRVINRHEEERGGQPSAAATGSCSGQRAKEGQEAKRDLRPRGPDGGLGAAKRIQKQKYTAKSGVTSGGISMRSQTARTQRACGTGHGLSPWSSQVVRIVMAERKRAWPGGKHTHSR